MDAEPTVLELLGQLITRTFNVGPEPVGEQDLSHILQTEKVDALQSTAVPTCDSTANEKAEDGTLLNIQGLVGTTNGIGNVVESVETNLQGVQTDGIIPPALVGNRTGQHLQDIGKTANVSVMLPSANIQTTICAGHSKVLEDEKLHDQESERSVNSNTDSTEKLTTRGSSPNSNLRSTLSTFLSSQLDSEGETRNLPKREKTISKSLVEVKESLLSVARDDHTRGHALKTHVAHIAYTVNPSTTTGHTYAMQKHKMEELIAKPYMCGVCGHVFPSTSKLVQHVTLYHSIRPPEESERDRSHHGDSMSDLTTGGTNKGEASVETEAQREEEDFDGRLSENLEQNPAEDKSSMNSVSDVTFKDAVHHGNVGQRSSVQRQSRKKKIADLEDGEITPKQKQKVNAEPTFQSVCGTSEIGEEKGSLKSGNKGKKAFKCEFCKAVFTSNKYRYKHRVSSHPDAIFQCPGCEKSYKVTEKDKWQHHIRIHNKPPTKPKPDSYQCDICSVAFRAANAIAIHMQTFHPEAVQSEKSFCCEICGNLFRTRSALKSHQTLVHSDLRPFQCRTCAKVFKKESYLKLHQRTHTGEKPYMCKYCNKTFSSTTGRRCHERTHTNEKPYVCSHCGSSFRAKPQLVEHERTHTLERPFICEICGKSFASRTSIKIHKFLHTGRKPHKCSSCSRTFAQKSNLMDHFRSIHSQEKPYECTVCDAKFTRSTSRKLHMEKKHGLKITVRQGRPPIHESNQAVDSIVSSCLSIDVSSVLTPTEQVTFGDTFSIVVNNTPY